MDGRAGTGLVVSLACRLINGARCSYICTGDRRGRRFETGISSHWAVLNLSGGKHTNNRASAGLNRQSCANARARNIRSICLCGDDTTIAAARCARRGATTAISRTRQRDRRSPTAMREDSACRVCARGRVRDVHREYAAPHRWARRRAPMISACAQAWDEARIVGIFVADSVRRGRRWQYWTSWVYRSLGAVSIVMLCAHVVAHAGGML